MFPTTLPTLLYLALFTTHALGIVINLGFATDQQTWQSSTTRYDWAIWIDGESPCHYTYLGSAADGHDAWERNGGWFTLPNGETYRIIKEISTLAYALVYPDGVTKSRGDVKPVGIVGECEDGQGGYFVRQEVQFSREGWWW